MASTEPSKLHHVPESLAALEAELSQALEMLAELEKTLTPVLNPTDIKESALSLKEDPKRAPLAERIWMNVQTAQIIRNSIMALTLRLEL